MFLCLLAYSGADVDSGPLGCDTVLMLLLFERAVVPSFYTWTVNAKDEGTMIPQNIT
jgi:hypothetical protein